MTPSLMTSQGRIDSHIERGGFCYGWPEMLKETGHQPKAEDEVEVRGHL